MCIQLEVNKSDLPDSSEVQTDRQTEREREREREGAFKADALF